MARQSKAARTAPSGGIRRQACRQASRRRVGLGDRRPGGSGLGIDLRFDGGAHAALIAHLLAGEPVACGTCRAIVRTVPQSSLPSRLRPPRLGWRLPVLGLLLTFSIVPQRAAWAQVVAPAAAPPMTSPGQALTTLRGQVYARGSILRVAGADIVVETRLAEGQKANAAEPAEVLARATSDDQGHFQVDIPGGRARIRISAAGFDSLRQDLSLGSGVQTAEFLLRRVPASRQPFSTQVRGEPPHQGQQVSLRGEELTTLPGSLGDPFRAMGLLPGVATPLPLLPVFVVRGASPGMNGFFLDGMRIPQLFHLLVGGGIVHARLVDQIDFYPGAYDASLGRYGGGIIDGKTRGARSDGYHGELELKLYDISALAELRLPGDLRIAVSGHYGYPGPIVHAIDSRVNVGYWDYQVRLDYRGLTVQALGSFDEVTIVDPNLTASAMMPVSNTFRVMFHRLQAVYRGRVAGWQLEAGAVGGIDEMTIFQGNGVRKLSLNLRANAAYRQQIGRGPDGAWLRLRLGIDGEVSRFTAENFDSDPVRARPDDLGELGTSRDGIVGAAYAVASLGPLHPGRLTLTLSGRLDVYRAGTVTLLGFDPRLQFRSLLTSWLTVHGGVGIYQQPPSFPVPLPGIDTFALQLGLQRATHFALGQEATLPAGLFLSLTGFYQRYEKSNDIVLDFTPQLCTSPPPESLTGYVAQVMRQVDGSSYGMEFMLRRQRGRFTGWIAYTLGRAERAYTCGLRPADYDQTHVLNTVLQVRLPWNLMLGGRFFYSTGRPYTQLVPPDGAGTVRNNRRIPDTFQFDVRIDREWLFRRFALDVFLEVVNATYSQAVFGIAYPRQGNVTRFDMPELNGFNWILPSVGVRGRF